MLYFIHGLNGNPDNWIDCIDFFSEKGIEAQAIDFRKDKDLRKTRFQDYVDTIVRKVTEDDVLIGHSMGGLLVQKVAEKQKIKAGICLCPAPARGYRIKTISFFDQLRHLPYIVFNRPFKVSFSLACKVFLNCVSYDEAKRAHGHMHKESAKVTVEVMKGKISVDPEKINSPLFFIAMHQDKAIPPKVVKKTAERFDSSVTILPGCHYIFANVKIINQQILRILREIDVEKKFIMYDY
jgi:hypothetical protein